jgi:hypothetical protein
MFSFGAEDFFCSLAVLSGGLGLGKLQFFIKKMFEFFSAVIFFKYFVIKTLDPYSDRYLVQNAGSGSGSVSNENGSETLEKAVLC